MAKTSILTTLKDKIASIESEIEEAAKAEAAKVESAVATGAEKVSAAVGTDWKALALEASEHFASVTKKFEGDATYDFAQKFIAKVRAAL